jgi:low affinity Fe/Cu permease
MTIQLQKNRDIETLEEKLEFEIKSEQQAQQWFEEQKEKEGLNDD